MKFSMLITLGSLCVAGGVATAQTFTEQGTSLLGTASYNLRSASFGDFDNDGDPDLLLQGVQSGRRLYRNDIIETGEVGFTDVTSAYGPVASDTTGWSAAWADYDGDGDVDVFLGQTNSGVRGDLFRNDGESGFTDVSATTINDPGFHQNVAWADMDSDGLLDLVIAMEGPERHEIYIQEDDGSFTQSGASTGFQEDFGTKAYGMAIGDTDGDGDLDVYISTCRSGGNIRNNFYQNLLEETGSLAFVDVSDANGTQFLDNSYSTEFHDFDNDGDLDLFMVGADTEKSKIWRNDGDGSFTDTDTIRGADLLSDTAGDLNGGWTIDYDNDGDLDLFFHDHKPNSGRDEARKLYRNDGDWNFTDVTSPAGLEDVNRGAYDSTWADFDLDGDLDLIAPTDGSSRQYVFLNDSDENGNNWLHVELRAEGMNTRAVGAQVYAKVSLDGGESVTLRRDKVMNAGAFAQNDVPVHFGLGSGTVVEELRIVWPDGETQLIENVGANQFLMVEQGRLSGDSNNDGVVDMADMMDLFQIYLSGEDSRWVNAAQDLVSDGKITPADAQAAFEMMLK